MKRGLIKKSIILVGLVLLLVTSVRADDITFKQDLDKSISDIDNIRRQFMAISESGYFNHVEDKLNQDNIDLTNIYIKQIPEIRRNLEEHKNENLDKFSRRKINTLLGIIIYLTDMGENLIDYLSSTNLKDQYDFYNIHLKINNFITSVLVDVKNADY